MVPLPFSDIYHLRKVAESSSKPCFICYKPTPAVLVSEDGKADFFYVCETHLKDASFAIAKSDPEVEAAKEKQKRLDSEIEVLKKKWEEKKKKKQEDKEKDKDKDKDKDKEQSKDKEKTSAKKEIEPLENEKKEQEAIAAQTARVFILNKGIHNIRLENWRNAQRAKQTQKMLKSNTLFPKVPSHTPSPPPAP